MTGKISVLLVSLSVLALANVARADVEISSKPTSNMSCAAGVCTATAQKAVLNVTDLANMLANGDVVVKTGLVAKDIDIDQPLTWSGTSRLTLDAQQSVTVKKQVTVAGQGALTVVTNDSGGANGKTKTGEFIIVPEHGSVQFWDLASSLIIDGNAYTLVGDIKTLAADIAANPSGFYAFAKPYDASVDATYTSSPVSTTFTGTFEGLGNRITNLTINFRASGDAVGFFAALSGAANLQHLVMSHANLAGIDGIGTYGGIGLIAGVNSGSIQRSSASGMIVVPGGNDAAIGSIAGEIGAGSRVSNSHGNIRVKYNSTGSASVGGIAGQSRGTVAQVFSYGVITGRRDALTNTGGVVGDSYGIVEDSFATTGLTAGRKGAGNDGGLVGHNESGGQIVTSYAAGEITRKNNEDTVLGGLIGFDAAAEGSISFCYWDLGKGISDPSQGAGNIRNDPGITGLTTEELQSRLPNGFSPNVWGQNKYINNGFPYLLADRPKK
jgi:hypothetical protein